jgi:hypothetical protein
MTADTLQNKTLHHERECLVDAVDALTWLIDRDGRVAECETLRAWVVGLLPLVDERRLEDLRREAAGLASEIARLGYMPDTWPGGA